MLNFTFETPILARRSRGNFRRGNSDIVEPSPERHHHGPVVRLDKPIADTAGRVARPYRAVDVLAIMEKRSITAQMRAAGDAFRHEFFTAHLDPLRAQNLLRSSAGQGKAAGNGSEATMVAREHVWRALCAVGGPNSAGGACLWHVLASSKP